MRLPHNKITRSKIDIEQLESRKLLAAFGTPWPDPHALTISFPEDGAGVGTYSNVIREKFDTVAQRQQWQELALRAFQTWSVHADINVGLRNDHGLDFGASGLSTADPRFGDFRIGAIPQTGVMANVVPFQTIAGTYSGDILLNSNENYQYHDWADDVPPDTTNQPADGRDLFSVVLHESGNALGLSDAASVWAVMFGHYTVPKGVLTQEDIDRIVELYGARTDPYELSDNDQLQLATLISTPVGFQPDSAVISTGGSLSTETDVDYYQLTPIVGHDSATIRLRAAGISLLKSRVEVLDSAGQVLASSNANSVFDNDVAIELSGLQNHSTIYIRVTGAAQDVYAVGDYDLQVDYRSTATQAADSTPGDYDSGADSLFANFDLIDPETDSNDVIADAQTAPEAAAFSLGSRFEFTSSVSSATDIDYWKITAPENVSGRLVVNLAGVGNDPTKLQVRIVDDAGQPVGASGYLSNDGNWTMEVAEPQANHEYFVHVSVDPNSTVDVGNYVASAEFTTPSNQMNHLVAGSVSTDLDEFFRWTATKSKLFRFDLKATDGSSGELVKLTIYDAHTKEMRMVLASPSDVTRTGFAWLTEGDYILRFTAVSRTGGTIANIGFDLDADGISDDQDNDGDGGDGSDPYAYYYYEQEDTSGLNDYDYYYYYYYP